MTRTAQGSNEAAERLRDWLPENVRWYLDEALAAERRATVERIRARLVDHRPLYWLQRILDEEAAR